MHVIRQFGDDTREIAGRTYPIPSLVEDDDGIRWYLVADPLIDPHTWTQAHADGAAGLLMAVHPWAAMLTETFLETRREVPGGYDSPAWRTFGDEPPTYLDVYRAAAEETAVSPSVSQSFVHLHVHTEYSALDGLSTCEEVVHRAVADGNPAVAITDHGVCSGHPAFQRACDKAGIKPIFGMEAYLYDGDRTWRPEAGDADGQKQARDYSHLILLALDNDGLRNLWALSTEGYRDGFYHKPRIDFDSLRRHADGLIATTACLGGPLSRMLLDGRQDEAEALLGRLMELFPDRLYLEIQPTDQEEQIRLNELLVALAERYDLPLVACSDSHYPAAEDKPAHVTWLACQTSPDNEAYWHFEHMHTEAELRAALGYLPETTVDAAIANTAVIADRCTARISGSIIAPVFTRSPEADAERLLDLAIGNWKKVAAEPDQQTYLDRFRREMNLLVDKSFCGYFLMVADYVRWAKANGIMVGPGRGSGAASLVSYLAGITDVDPIKNGLLFERFLTEGRKTLPDFDIDFPASKRQEIQNYVRQRYGENYVIRVGTHLRYKSKGVLNKLFGVMKDRLPEEAFADAKAISALITEAEASTAGLGLSWDELLAQQEALHPYMEKYPQVFRLAERLVGRLNSYGKHAAGLVIATDSPLTDRYPMRGGEDGQSMISQFEFEDLENLGLIKFDFLTIRNLDTIQMAVDLIRDRHGVEINFSEWADEDFADPQVWSNLQEGRTLGVFQIETRAGTELTLRMHPESVTDLSLILALDRPGPQRSGLTDTYLRRRAGQEEVYYPDPRTEPFLEITKGCMVYQEQVMQLCMTLAGYDSTEADGVRKILGKKKVELVTEAGQKFVAGCIRGGMEQAPAEHIWAQMAEFAKYGFNLAHSYSYALISFYCAWLKFHYPAEFLAAALSTVDKDRIMEFIDEARRMDIAVLPPDINASGRGFALVDDGVIRYGLDAIKGVGDKAVADLMLGQPYTDWDDFLARKGPKANAGVIATLARIGAFDSLPDIGHRRALVERLEAEKDGSAATCIHKDETVTGAPNDLPCRFDWTAEPPPVNPKTGKKLKPKPPPKRCTKACRQYVARGVPEPITITPYTAEEIRQIETQMLGGFLSSTPFDAIPDELRADLLTVAERLQDGPEGIYRVAALITKVRPYTDSSGRRMGFLTLRTEAGEVDTVCFSDQWTRHHAGFRVGDLVLTELRKKMRLRDGVLQPSHEIVEFVNTQP